MRALLLIAAFALASATALLAWRDELPDVEIRYQPRQTQAGRVFPGHALGQGFTCEFDGLHAIDVALVSLGGASATPLELAVRVREPDGPVLRRARLEPSLLPSTDGWARFEFEPIPDSAGVAFWFELASAEPTSHAPWVRYRGVPYLVRAWGARVIEGRVQEGELLPEPPRGGPPDLLFADLCALAFAVDGLDGAAGIARLSLSDPATGDVLREAELAPGAPHASGWAFFSFAPLADTRWRALHYRLELPDGARLVGNEDGHSLIAFHAAGALDTAALGATWRGEELGDRDLVFRAWSASGARPLLARLAARGGVKLALALLASLGACLALARCWRIAGERA